VFAIGGRICDSVEKVKTAIGQQFHIRQANHADVGELRILIELSVRGLQRNDYTPAQIEGALGHALGLDTQLIEDGTYFAAVPRSKPELIVGCGGWSYRKTLLAAIMDRIERRPCLILPRRRRRSEPSSSILNGLAKA
jgi:hypothetical protein